ncbi:MAG TPA: RNA-guided pseudouridylation complex pseudouridine synthase subunit Cbf5 [Thermoplasmatales archaeon]|nr:RNA-guided pseudouridylation complex pseudouridine synthase subunit Cbf5 [Thermoplasmatales archaeon]
MLILFGGRMPAKKWRMLIKEDAETNPLFGKRPASRTIEELIENGAVIVDKPKGPTSHQVASWVRDIFHVAKAGHGGTLDPNVTGVLPVALQNGTKAIGFLHGMQKEYVGVMRLHDDVGKKQIREAAKSFIGKIWQIPPKEAAVKRVRRQRTIYYLNILEIDGRDVLFKVGCEGGTYIRVLCTDIGKKLGCGAHMHELRRTKGGPFTEYETVILQDLLDAYLFWREDGDQTLREYIHPVEALLAEFPPIVLKDSAVDAVCHGANVAIPGVARVAESLTKGSTVTLKTLKGEAVAVATALMDAAEIMEKDKGVVADTRRVIMKRGTYPPMWKTLR